MHNRSVGKFTSTQVCARMAWACHRAATCIRRPKTRIMVSAVQAVSVGVDPVEELALFSAAVHNTDVL